MTEPLSSPYPREVPPTLLIEGSVSAAYIDTDDSIGGGRAYVKTIRVALVTGGRALLGPVPGKWYRHGLDAVKIRLTPEIEHRIRTSGGVLTDEEIRVGMEQLRESDEDMEARTITETMHALVEGQQYARQQFELAIEEGDEAALSRCWDMTRKTITLRKRLERLGQERAAARAANPPAPKVFPGTTRHHGYQPDMAAAPVSVVTEAAPTGPQGGRKDD